MKNFVQKGDVLSVPAPRAVASGEGMLIDALFGVATASAASGAAVEMARVGVFELPKVAATAVGFGAPIYWDDTNYVVTPVATDNTLIGAAAEAADAADAVALVLIDGVIR